MCSLRAALASISTLPESNDSTRPIGPVSCRRLLAAAHTAFPRCHAAAIPQYQDSQGPGGCPFLWNGDIVGHGTHCTGTIAAPQNGIGVIGVIPKVRLAARFCARGGVGGCPPSMRSRHAGLLASWHPVSCLPIVLTLPCVYPQGAEVYTVRVFNQTGDVSQGEGLVYGSSLVRASLRAARPRSHGRARCTSCIRPLER